ncbi:hypothetical protein yc1106_05145 [Curvularia clavata]|uniref:AP2/ERF domain-containing protein n=1 Tax=Curvularia clavata TaxID=95742 RepID=A0A9Q9DTX7_CURCL|nr:hypothetical protein yc1106_05145 [Curvularia clavata]
MFPSVKDRARQLFGEAAVPTTSPPPPVSTGRKGPPIKATSASKSTPEPKTPSKGSRADAKSKKNSPPPVEETPRAIGAWPSPFEQFKSRAAPPPAKATQPTSSKTTSSKSAKATSTTSKTVKPSKEKVEKASRPSEKKSRSKSPPTTKAAAAPPKKVPEPKVVAKKKTESKPAPEPKKTARPKLQTRTSSRPKIQRSSSSSSLDSDDDEEDSEDEDLREACLREVSKVTGLKGKNLAISLRQRSSGGWYAALKDVSADKYLKMWMNRDKTFDTQEEALEAYLVFVKKMNTDMKLFGPMSPKPGKSKGFF